MVPKPLQIESLYLQINLNFFVASIHFHHISIHAMCIMWMVILYQSLQEISAWFMLQTGAAPCRAFENVSTWLAGPSAVELLRPPKVPPDVVRNGGQTPDPGNSRGEHQPILDISRQFSGETVGFHGFSVSMFIFFLLTKQIHNVGI